MSNNTVFEIVSKDGVLRLLRRLRSDNCFTCVLIRDYFGNEIKKEYQEFIVQKYRSYFLITTRYSTGNIVSIMPRSDIYREFLHQLRIEMVERFFKEMGVL